MFILHLAQWPEVNQSSESKSAIVVVCSDGHVEGERRMRRRDCVCIVFVSASACALLALALVWSRDNTRRGQCINNLRQIGAALQLYEATWTMLPMASRWTTDGMDLAKITPGPIDPLYPNIFSIPPGTYSDTTHENWAALLLPFLGNDSLYGAFDFAAPMQAKVNAGARSTPCPVFRCAADEFNREDNLYLRKLPDGADGTYARGNYAINGGPHGYCFFPGFPSEPCPDGMYYELNAAEKSFKWWGGGVAGINKCFSSTEVITGRSHMVVVDEIRAGIHSVDSRGVWALGQIGGSITWNHGQYGDVNTPNDPYERGDDVVGCGKLHEFLGSEMIDRRHMPCCSYIEANKQAGARSMHSKGVYVLMLDGTARFLTDKIDPSLWHVLHARDVPSDLPMPF